MTPLNGGSRSDQETGTRTASVRHPLCEADDPGGDGGRRAEVGGVDASPDDETDDEHLFE